MSSANVAGPHLLCISAHDEAVFRARAAALAERVAASPDEELNDLCYTLNACHEHRRLRAGVIGATGAELAEALRGAAPRACAAGKEGPRVALMFTGQGSQYPGMARGLHAGEPAFRRAFDEAAACFGDALGAPLQALLFEGAADAARLAETDLTQPAVFAVDYAIGRLLLDWGLRPYRMLGHSVGEFAAACLAGALELSDAARLVRERGRLMRALPNRGAMAAVFAPGEAVAPLLAPLAGRLFIAAFNGAHVVVSGEAAALDELAPRLDAAGLAHRRLDVSQAFHTPLLQPMVGPFLRAFDGVAVREPRVGIISNVTGETVDRPLDAAYWARHVLEPVRFEQSVRHALSEGVEVFVEAGPERVLAGMCRGLLGAAAIAVPTLQRKGDDVRQLRAALAALYERGVPLDFAALHGSGARRVHDLPAYPLARASLGRATAARATRRVAEGTGSPARGGITPSVWTWSRVAASRGAPLGPGRLLVIAPDHLRAPLERVMGAPGERWVLATSGAEFSRRPDDSYTFERTSETGLARIVASVRAEGRIAGVAHLLGGWSGQAGGDAGWDEGVELGVHTLVFLAKALREGPASPAIPLVLVTRGAIGAVAADTAEGAWQTPAIAVAQALGLEEPGLDARALDVAAEATDEALARAALDELTLAPDVERVAALRAGDRLGRSLGASAGQLGDPFRPRDGETYLVTGGATGIGAEVALHLARQARVNLVITGRSALPPPSAWGAPASTPEVEERLRLMRALDAAGARIRYETVDVTDREGMRDVVRRVRHELGPVSGVVHCAGVVDLEALRLTAKTAEGLTRVLAPKVRGTVVVDDSTRAEPLRIFAAFSSVSASSIAWAKGLGDYAAANLFVDRYCELRAARGGAGRTVAINWSLWRGTGMGRAPGMDAMAERSGLEPLELETALRALDDALSRREPVLHVVVPRRADGRPADRLPERATSAPGASAEPQGGRPRSRDDVHRIVCEVVAEQVGLAASALDPAKTFRDLGVDSQGAVEALRRLERRLDCRLYPTLFFEFKTPEELANHLAASSVPADAPRSEAAKPEAPMAPHGPAAAEAVLPAISVVGDRDVAIVAMACRFPGADGLESYWDLLASGRSVIREAPRDRFPADEYFDASGKDAHASYSRWGSFVDEPFAFDAMFFGISPREAASMDPQQRLFLEVAWQAIQRAGYGRERPAELGVFVGCESNAYAEHFINAQRHAAILRHLERRPWYRALPEGAREDLVATLGRHLAPGEITSDVVAGNGLNEVAARVSHFLDARGPSLIVNSACSSSLVAIHYACESLHRGEARMAIAGGVFLNLGTTASVFLSRLKALSPTGRCRPFDARADGMVLGEGAAALLLKPLAAALRDRDHVHAVIKGSAVNNDGHSSGITVPSASGQAEAVRRAYEVAGVDPTTVSYVECHGTATPLGDPIEIQGLALSLGASPRPGPCVIGSVKGAVGHMLSAAGASSVLKVALALQHRTIPPTVGYAEPSPHIDFGGRFEVASGAARPWAAGAPRRAGVNAFGFGGTNCHLILEEHVAPTAPGAREDAHLLFLSARTSDALEEWARRVARSVAARPELSVASICSSLHRSQRPLSHVAAAAVCDRAGLADALDAIAAGREGHAVHRGKVNPRRAASVALALGADWLPTRAAAEALVAAAPRLASRLSEALDALRQASPGEAGLLAQYVVARRLGELATPWDAVVGEGRARPVAAWRPGGRRRSWPLRRRAPRPSAGRSTSWRASWRAAPPSPSRRCTRSGPRTSRWRTTRCSGRCTTPSPTPRRRARMRPRPSNHRPAESAVTSSPDRKEHERERAAEGHEEQRGCDGGDARAVPRRHRPDHRAPGSGSLERDAPRGRPGARLDQDGRAPQRALAGGASRAPRRARPRGPRGRGDARPDGGRPVARRRARRRKAGPGGRPARSGRGRAVGARGRRCRRSGRAGGAGRPVAGRRHARHGGGRHRSHLRPSGERSR